MRPNPAVFLVLLPLITAPAAALGSNRFVNPDFDDNLALNGWNTGGFFASHDDEDRDACSSSGSARVSSQLINAHLALIQQCVSVTPGETIEAHFDVRVPFTGAQGILHLLYASECVDDGSPPPAASPVGTTWTTLQATGVVPAGKNTVIVRVLAFGGQSFDLLADRAHIATPGQIFVDDFEIGEPCRWAP